MGISVENFLRLSLNRLSIVLIISVIFLSIPQQNVPSKYYLPAICSETLMAIHPNLIFSTYLGGNDGGEDGRGIAITNDKSYYVSGQTSSSDFPTMNAYNSSYSGEDDTFITKFSLNNFLLWSTYFGGSKTDINQDIAVAVNGNCYVTGQTESIDFPTKNPNDSTFNGGYFDAFVAKFAANGSLLWSTYLGGGGDWDNGYSIAVASDESCYVTGETSSSDFPSQNGHDNTYNGGNFDAFVTKFAANGTLLWSTYLGGSGNDIGYGLAVTDDGSCYVTGLTRSTDYPTENAYDSTYNGGFSDIFVTKFSSEGNLLWSTLLGGTGWDEGWGIAVGKDSSCYVTGYTVSTNFPTQFSYSDTYSGGDDVFLTKFASNGSLLWSTYLGGDSVDHASDVAVTNNESCYITGYTTSNNFPTLYAYDDSKASGFDTFVTKFYSNGSLLWSTYLGGDSTDKGYGLVTAENDSCYIVGDTHSADFPTLNAYDSTLGATSDIFIVKFVDILLPYTPPTSPTSHITYHGFLAFIIVIPIIAFIYSKKRK
jgi:hypothetical protein